AQGGRGYGGNPNNQYDQYGQYNNPYDNQYNRPQQAAGQGYRQQDVEMTTVTKSSNDVTSFFDEISSIQDSIKKIQNNVDQISELHSRSLGTISEDEATKRQLDAKIAETRTMANQ
ncbi:4473_t:CDS:2, partial [Paraglomus occultum]